MSYDELHEVSELLARDAERKIRARGNGQANGQASDGEVEPALHGDRHTEARAERHTIAQALRRLGSMLALGVALLALPAAAHAGVQREGAAAPQSRRQYVAHVQGSAPGTSTGTHGPVTLYGPFRKPATAAAFCVRAERDGRPTVGCEVLVLTPAREWQPAGGAAR